MNSWTSLCSAALCSCQDNPFVVTLHQDYHTAATSSAAPGTTRQNVCCWCSCLRLAECGLIASRPRLQLLQLPVALLLACLLLTAPVLTAPVTAAPWLPATGQLPQALAARCRCCCYCAAAAHPGDQDASHCSHGCAAVHQLSLYIPAQGLWVLAQVLQAKVSASKATSSTVSICRSKSEQMMVARGAECCAFCRCSCALTVLHCTLSSGHRAHHVWLPVYCCCTSHPACQDGSDTVKHWQIHLLIRQKNKLDITAAECVTNPCSLCYALVMTSAGGLITCAHVLQLQPHQWVETEVTCQSACTNTQQLISNGLPAHSSTIAVCGQGRYCCTAEPQI